MMFQKIIYDSPLIYIFLAQLVFFPLVTYAGVSIGKKDLSDITESSALLPTTIMGILALIMGFTFSMSVARYDARKSLVLTEANSIESVYSHADTIDEPYRSHVKDNLKRYIETRLQLYDSKTSLDRLPEINAKSNAIQDEIWKDALRVLKAGRDNVNVFFEESVGKMIDVSRQREFAFENRVPLLVYLIIFALTTLGLFSLGYMYGVEHKVRESRISILVLSMMFAVVIALIKDLDNPHYGLIHADQSSMIQLKDRMK